MGNLYYQLSTDGATLRREISLRTHAPFLESSSRGFSRVRDTRRETGREGNGQEAVEGWKTNGGIENRTEPHLRPPGAGVLHPDTYG